MKNSIFLSASIPDPRRAPEFAKTADSVLITSAVSALVYVILGRRPLVWGGHPAITPMVWTVSDDMGIDYSQWVLLYQSDFFVEDFPEENQRFKNIVYTEQTESDRSGSLAVMREQMFTENQFDAAVFIGGMEGVREEFKAFQRHHPDSRVLPVASTGGAALELAQEFCPHFDSLWSQLDYIKLFHSTLNVSVGEDRCPRPASQLSDIEIGSNDQIQEQNE